MARSWIGAGWANQARNRKPKKNLNHLPPAERQKEIMRRENARAIASVRRLLDKK